MKILLSIHPTNFALCLQGFSLGEAGATWGTGGLVTITLLPFVLASSDRCQHRWGRRKIYLIAGEGRWG